MRQISTVLVSMGLGLALAALGSMSAGAQPAARPHHHHLYAHLHYRHFARARRAGVISRLDEVPLTVNKRSWLDPGNVVAANSLNDYVVEGTYFRQTPDEKYFPSRFHEDELPRPLYVPGGNVTPLVVFATPGKSD